MSTQANRGKYAEGKIKDHLKRLNDAHMNFCYNRVQDAHAAGGKFVPQPGDFQAFVDLGPIPPGLFEKANGFLHWSMNNISRNFIIEVKEVKHDFRLAHANYSTDKVARVEKRCKAGTEAIVMVYHTTTKLWRAVPQAVFNDRSTGGSWDLRAWPIVDYRTALSEFLGVLP